MSQGELLNTEEQEFGGLTGNVSVYYHSFEYDGETVSGEISIAEFGDFKMVSGVDLDNDFTYQLLTIVPR